MVGRSDEWISSVQGLLGRLPGSHPAPGDRASLPLLRISLLWPRPPAPKSVSGDRSAQVSWEAICHSLAGTELRVDLNSELWRPAMCAVPPLAAGGGEGTLGPRPKHCPAARACRWAAEWEMNMWTTRARRATLRGVHMAAQHFCMSRSYLKSL